MEDTLITFETAKLVDPRPPALNWTGFMQRHPNLFTAHHATVPDITENQCTNPNKCQDVDFTE